MLVIYCCERSRLSINGDGSGRPPGPSPRTQKTSNCPFSAVSESQVDGKKTRTIVNLAQPDETCLYCIPDFDNRSVSRESRRTPRPACKGDVVLREIKILRDVQQARCPNARAASRRQTRPGNHALMA